MLRKLVWVKGLTLRMMEVALVPFCFPPLPHPPFLSLWCLHMLNGSVHCNLHVASVWSWNCGTRILWLIQKSLLPLIWHDIKLYLSTCQHNFRYCIKLGTGLNNICVHYFSATSNSILDRAIDSEDSQHKDFLRLVRSHSYNCCIYLE